MKKIFLSLTLAFLAITGMGQQIINDPNAELREAKNFNAISVSNAFEVYLSQSNEEAVAVSATDKKFLEHVIVEVKNSVLRIRLDNNKQFWKGWNGKMRLKAYISFKNIERLEGSGACDIKIQQPIKAVNLAINLSGACNLAGKIDAQELKIDLSGASDASITGNASRLNIDVNGASHFKGYELITDYCDASASGASKINITVNKELSAHASGASDVNYKGSGLIKNIKTSGASNISRRS